MNKLPSGREAFRKAPAVVLNTSCSAPHRTVLGKERQKMDCQTFQTFAKSIRMTARRGSRQKYLSKSHLLPNNSSQRQMKSSMKMRQVGQRGETDGGVLMNETQHVRDRAMLLMGKNVISTKVEWADHTLTCFIFSECRANSDHLPALTGVRLMQTEWRAPPMLHTQSN